ncbi:hypothetical protein LVJ94_04780 [Pendulispora rubella]|uniref:Uncharacterized protein n=1 Tax=Pendulispora rubella TaxID=2741070 RepID=A0ABZ2L6J2_9BACT
MAKLDLGSIAESLFVDFMAPLVLGGEMTPGRPIGGRAALTLGLDRTVTDIDRRSHVQLARIRTARRLAPLDRLHDALPEEWALAACLHDLVQSTHHALDGLFRGRATVKLRTVALETLSRIPKPRSVAEALSRHTWFGRMFEITRLDTTVSWWVGSRSFFGSTPPPRLMTWPDLRRVHVKKAQTFLTDLPIHGEEETNARRAQKTAFEQALTVFLHHTPLTDLATLNRASPGFAWSRETLALTATRAGRTLVGRALRPLPEPIVNAALGRATRALLAAGAGPQTRVAAALLADLALTNAQKAILRAQSAPPVSSFEAPDEAFARVAGAVVARKEIAHSPAFSHAERAALDAYLQPVCESALGRDLAASLTA